MFSITRFAHIKNWIFRTGFVIFSIFLLHHLRIIALKSSSKICVGDFCLENCDPKMEISKNLDLRNSTVSLSQLKYAPPGGRRHCFLKLKRPQEVFFVKLMKKNITNSYIQIFWDYFDEKGMEKLTQIGTK